MCASKRSPEEGAPAELFISVSKATVDYIRDDWQDVEPLIEANLYNAVMTKI